MIITTEELLKGKATQIKGKEYLSTEAYVEPFLERMSKYTNDFRVQVKLPDQITLTKEGEINMEDVTYNRVNVEAILPSEYEFEGHQQVVGFVYALDTRKPIVKQYVGAIRSACLNLCVFNPDALSIQEINPESAINYSFLGHCLTMTDCINATLSKLSKQEFSKKECYTQVGTWVDNCLGSLNSFSSLGGKVKLSETLPVEVYKNLFYNEKSDYYTEDSIVSGFDIYNCFTDLICNSKRADIVNRFEKTYLVKNIMGI
jgi:hypothetical protein